MGERGGELLGEFVSERELREVREMEDSERVMTANEFDLKRVPDPEKERDRAEREVGIDADRVRMESG